MLIPVFIVGLEGSRKMGAVIPLQAIVMYCVFYTIFGSSIQCGQCECIQIRQDYILDCENLGINYIPEVRDDIRRHISHAYMTGNDIKTLQYSDFERWFSLEYIDLTDNPNFDCNQLVKIPQEVHVQVECVTKPSSKYDMINY